MKEYIERTDVLNLLEKINPVDFGSMFDYSAHGAVRECLRDVCYGVEDIPAADVVEVKHGRWIEDERTYPGPGLKNNLCSVCGEIAGSWKEGLEPGRKWAYCPNCGARMGKEDEHEAG